MRFFSMLIIVTFFSGSFICQTKTIPGEENGGYKTAIGVRIGETSGLAIKHFIKTERALEGILSIWPNSLSLTGLFEWYSATRVKGLNWYYGAGGHFSAGSRRVQYIYLVNNRDYYAYRYNFSGAAIGIDGVAGIEYKIPKTPFVFSFDLKPYMEVSNSWIYSSLDPGLGAKFSF